MVAQPIRVVRLGQTALDDPAFVVSFLRAHGAAAFAVFSYLRSRIAQGDAAPSYAEIAEDCGFSRRHAIATVGALVAAGWIERTPATDARGGYAANAYRVAHRGGAVRLLPANPSEDPSELPSEPAGEPRFTSELEFTTPPSELPSEDPGELGGVRGGRARRVLEPNVVDENTTTRKNPPLPPLFLAFWRAYPKTNGSRESARKAWVRLNPDPDLAEAIMAGLAKWQASDHWAKGYVKFAERFLGERMWEDDPAPARPAPGVAVAPTTKRTREDWLGV